MLGGMDSMGNRGLSDYDFDPAAVGARLAASPQAKTTGKPTGYFVDDGKVYDAWTGKHIGAVETVYDPIQAVNMQTVKSTPAGVTYSGMMPGMGTPMTASSKGHPLHNTFIQTRNAGRVAREREVLEEQEERAGRLKSKIEAGLALAELSPTPNLPTRLEVAAGVPEYRQALDATAQMNQAFAEARKNELDMAQELAGIEQTGRLQAYAPENYQTEGLYNGLMQMARVDQPTAPAYAAPTIADRAFQATNAQAIKDYEKAYLAHLTGDADLAAELKGGFADEFADLSYMHGKTPQEPLGRILNAVGLRKGTDYYTPMEASASGFVSMNPETGEPEASWYTLATPGIVSLGLVPGGILGQPVADAVLSGLLGTAKQLAPGTGSVPANLANVLGGKVLSAATGAVPGSIGGWLNNVAGLTRAAMALQTAGVSRDWGASSLASTDNPSFAVAAPSGGFLASAEPSQEFAREIPSFGLGDLIGRMPLRQGGYLGTWRV